MKKLVLIPLVLLLASSVVMAQGFAPAPGQGGKAKSTGLIPLATAITHSLDTSTITPLNSVSCNDGFDHTDNSYMRRFTLGDFGILGAFDVTSIDTAVEQANGSGADQSVTVNLYSIPIGTPLTFGALTLVGTSATTTANGTAYAVNFPVAGSVDATTDDLVVEFFTPDGNGAGNAIWVGSNPNGQTGPGYIAAADCGITEPTDLAAIGFPDMHWILVVNGDEGGDPCTLNFAPFKVTRNGNGVAVDYSIALDHNRGAVQKSAYIELQDMTGNVVASKRAGILDLDEGSRVRIKGSLRAPADLASGDYVFVLRLDGMRGFKDRRSPIFIP